MSLTLKTLTYQNSMAKSFIRSQLNPVRIHDQDIATQESLLDETFPYTLLQKINKA